MTLLTTGAHMQSRRFAAFTWLVLAYNVLVILWGAFVRATGSGAGCGSHWPLCNGVVVPRAPQIETLIEFSHRLTSGLAALLVLALVIWGFRVYGRGHVIRKSLVLCGILMILEALIGAGLVLFGWVADNQSVARTVSMALHLVNTFFLLAALAFTGWWATGGPRVVLRSQGWLAAAWLVGLGGMIFLGMSGAVTALGDTLFPAGSLAEGIRADFEPTAHFLVRMRIWHPVIAVIAAAYIVTLARTLASRRPSPLTARLANLHVALFVIQLVAGGINVVLLAPVWMQLVHLALACAVWLSLVLLGASAFSVPASGTLPEQTPPASRHVAAQ
jgi:heme A synthase